MSTLTVLTINIWNRLGPWDLRLPLLREGLKKLSPDVVGVQEVLSMEGFPGQVEALADELGFHTCTAGDWDLGGGLILKNAILSKFPFLETDSFALPNHDREPRCLQYGLVDLPHVALPFFNTHLTHRVEDSAIRLDQARFIKEKISSLVGREVEARGASKVYPAVLVGDFNAPPNSDEIRCLDELTNHGGETSNFTDCWDFARDKTQPIDPGHTFSRKNTFALTANEESKRIDYIWVRGRAGTGPGLPLEARLVFDKPTNGVFASDHFGVVAKLKL